MSRAQKYNWEAVRALAATGTPLPLISQQLGVDYNTLKSRARRENWLIPQTFGTAKKRDRALALRKQQQTFHLVQKTAADIVAKNGTASRIHLSGAIRKASAHLESMPEPDLISNHQALQSISRAASNVHAWHQDQEKHHTQNVNIALLSLPPDKLASLSETEILRLAAPSPETNP